KANEFTEESTLQCPEYTADIHVGTGGRNNLDIHKGSKASSVWPKSKGQTNRSLHTFFKVKAPLNPPLVTAPLPIHAPKILSKLLTLKSNDIPMKPMEPAFNVCQNASELLSNLCREMNQIPLENPPATGENCLHPFRGDPAASVHQDADDWEDLLNPMLKQVFGWGEEEMHNSVKEMMCHGRYGLDGFVTFLDYFVMHWGLKGRMLESKVMAVIRELEARCVTA
ncbi:hypothetical protein L208DRAFT_1348341, partial [Tricholoma matsutake]